MGLGQSGLFPWQATWILRMRVGGVPKLQFSLSNGPGPQTFPFLPSFLWVPFFLIVVADTE